MRVRPTRLSSRHRTCRRGWRSIPTPANGNGHVTGGAGERLIELHAVNNRQDAKRRRKPEKIVVGTSDPEAALGRDKHNVFRLSYNVQLVRDLDSPLCLAYEVFAQPTDAGTLGPMLERVANWTGVGTMGKGSRRSLALGRSQAEPGNEGSVGNEGGPK